MGEGQVQIEKQKINDVTVQETIGEISQDASEKQPKGKSTPWVARFPAHEEHGNYDQRDAGERNEEAVVVSE